jgi:hypothetical protein
MPKDETEKWYERNSAMMEKSLGKEHNMVRKLRLRQRTLASSPSSKFSGRRWSTPENMVVESSSNN